MKLACVRCKHKKIKCDRGDPTCHQCITASTECVYVERRKRPRLTQQKNDVRELNRRLEFLEQQLHGSDHTGSNSPRSRDESEETETEAHAHVSPGSSVARESGKESWIYRLASDTTRKFEKVNIQNHGTPTDTPDSMTVDDAISGLNEALDDLGNIRVRSEERVRRAPELHISAEEAKACIKIMKEMIASMVIPDIFISSLNLDIMEHLPDLVNSPYVRVDPAIRVAYWNAIFYGLHKLHGPGNPKSKIAYLKLLNAVPEWLGGATGTDLDGHCATLTAWTAINNFDYQLSWKFHCRACHFLKLKGVDRLDLTPIRSHEEEDRRQSLRYLYWLVLQTDVLFRLFYGKPASIKWKPGKVKPPTLFSSKNMKPSASQSTIYVVWIRYTVITAEIFDVLDSSPEGCKGPHSPEVIRQLDEYCAELEGLIDEWDLLSLMSNPKTSPVLSWLYADHIMNIYASIVGIRRLARHSSEPQVVDTVTLRAARQVISIILNFDWATADPDQNYFIFFHFISFYPFCAVFSLYEHVLTCPNPDDCETDIASLDRVGSVMTAICGISADFKPLSNTINALNKVSRSMQEYRRNHASTTSGPPSNTNIATPSSSSGPGNENFPQTSFSTGLHTFLPPHQQPPSSSPGPSLNNPQQQHRPDADAPPFPHPNQPQAMGMNIPLPTIPSSTLDTFQIQLLGVASPTSTSPSLSNTHFPSLQDFTNLNPAGGDVQPVDFIRALENDFIGRNWHETWWDMNGGMDLDGAGVGGDVGGQFDGGEAGGG